MASHTERTLKELRNDGYSAAVVEKWIPGANIRRDMFGIIDIVAIKYLGETLGVQVCAYSGHAEHKKKILASPYTRLWLSADRRLEIHSWRKVKNRWHVRIEEITVEMLIPTA